MIEGPLQVPDRDQAATADLSKATSGFWRRLVANIIDAALLAALGLGANLFLLLGNPRAVFPFNDGMNEGEAFVAAVAVSIGLAVPLCAFFEWSLWSATPGKRLLGLRLVAAGRNASRFSPPGLLRLILRNVFKLVIVHVTFFMCVFLSFGIHDAVMDSVSEGATSDPVFFGAIALCSVAALPVAQAIGNFFSLLFNIDVVRVSAMGDSPAGGVSGISTQPPFPDSPPWPGFSESDAEARMPRSPSHRPDSRS